MTRPWLPPEQLTYAGHFGPKNLIRSRTRAILSAALKPGATMPPEPDPSERELRWKAEDRWLSEQWRLATE